MTHNHSLSWTCEFRQFGSMPCAMHCPRCHLGRACRRRQAWSRCRWWPGWWWHPHRTCRKWPGHPSSASSLPRCCCCHQHGRQCSCPGRRPRRSPSLLPRLVGQLPQQPAVQGQHQWQLGSKIQQTQERRWKHLAVPQHRHPAAAHHVVCLQKGWSSWRRRAPETLRTRCWQRGTWQRWNATKNVSDAKCFQFLCKTIEPAAKVSKGSDYCSRSKTSLQLSLPDFLPWPSLSLSLVAFCYYSSLVEFLWKKRRLHHHTYPQSMLYPVSTVTAQM